MRALGVGAGASHRITSLFSLPLELRTARIEFADTHQTTLEFSTRTRERIVGKKIGVTSKPVQDMLGVHQPDFGFLTDAMQVPDGGTIDIASRMIQPRAEAEIALILGAPLKGPGVTPADVLAATASLAPCFEVVDSRIDRWDIRIVDTVADNASCGLFVLGAARVPPAGLDLAALEVRVRKNGSD